MRISTSVLRRDCRRPACSFTRELRLRRLYQRRPRNLRSRLDCPGVARAVKNLLSLLVAVAGTILLWAAVVAAFCLYAAGLLFIGGRIWSLRGSRRRWPGRRHR